MQSTSGIVVEIENEKAFVKISRNTACENCGACHFDEKTLNLKVTAINQVNAKIGDRVELSLENVNYFRASFYLYGIPLITMLSGIFLGLFMFPKLGMEPSDIFSIILGLIFMGISYVIIRGKRDEFASNTKYMSVITGVLSHNNLPVVDFKN